MIGRLKKATPVLKTRRIEKNMGTARGRANRYKEENPMKIAMIGQKIVPSREGGVEIVVEELSTRMAAQGHELTLFNRKRKHAKGEQLLKEYKGCKIKEIFTINKKAFDAIIYAFFATLKVRKMAKKGEFDVLHFHAEGPCYFLNLLPRRNKRKYKIVVTVHGLDWQRGKWGGFASKVLRTAEKRAVKYADEIIVLSKNNQKYFFDKYHRETTYIPNGIELPTLKPADFITERWGLTPNSYVLFLARIVPEKGLQYLIPAWKKVVEQTGTDKKLVIAGGPSHSDDYYEEIKFMCEGDPTIVMTGFVKGLALEELYSNAYLYVLPSDIEGMPMSLLEALSYGNVCLVSDIPENTEVINEDCFVFERGNIDRLRHQLKKIIRLQVQTHENMSMPHSWDEVTEKTLQLYERDGEA